MPKSSIIYPFILDTLKYRFATDFPLAKFLLAKITKAILTI